jgi:spore coat protein CotH
MADFYGTDVEVPADLIADGIEYPGVGSSFRGNSSYRMTSGSLKKSFGLSINHTHPQLRLLGYRTLNLLNSNADPSFLREVLFSRISREYIPAPKANFVNLVINGESWGLYINVQQFNGDFTREWFGSAGGARWKVLSGSGGGGLVYRGEDPETYRRTYELKTSDTPKVWKDLVNLFRVLSETPASGLEEALGPLFNIDGALWFLALENVFIDGDGYIGRGSDFLLYRDPGGRFHMITYDNNETFRPASGGGPNRWPPGGAMLSPLAYESEADRPVISKLLAVPKFKERYLENIRTLTRTWLDWKNLGPLVEGYRALIEESIAGDAKKPFRGWSAPPEIEDFVKERRDYLLGHPALFPEDP